MVVQAWAPGSAGRYALAALAAWAALGCEVPREPSIDGGSDARRATPRCEGVGPPSTLGAACLGALDCADGCFCNGTERCIDGVCAAGEEPCTDDIACTETACVEELAACGARLRHELCADDDPCNGAEVCDPVGGCVAGPRAECNDFLTCTTDGCVEGVGCRFEVRDLDGDGATDLACGGDDCDDDPRTGGAVGPARPEICGNAADDDCDGLFDYADPTCTPDNDDCDSARELPGPGTYAGSTRALGFDFDVACGPDLGPDATFWFRLEAPSDVVVAVDTAERELDGGQYVLLRPRSACAAGPDLACMTSAESLVTVHHALPAGEYAVIVKTGVPTDFALTLSIGAASSPADFDRCGPAAFDASAGGVFRGSFEGTSDDYPAPCRDDDGQPEVAFRLELTETRDVTLTARSFAPVEESPTTFSIGARARLALVRDCARSTATSIACDAGAPADDRTYHTTLRERALPAGSYWVLLERPPPAPGRAPDRSWELLVSLRDPTEIPPTDTCGAETVTVTASAVVTGSLDETSDDYTLPCHPGDFPDAAVRLVLDRDADVLLDARVTPTGGDAFVSLVRDCADPSTTLGCADADRFAFVPAARILRRPLAAGSYFVIIEAERRFGPSVSEPREWQLAVEIADPIAPVETGDACRAPAPLGGPSFTLVPASPAQRFDATACGAEAGYGESSVLGSPAVDDVYAFTLDEPRDVTIEVVVSGEEGYWLGLQSVCGDGTTMRRCERRAEAGASRTTYRAVPAGTHYFTVTHLLGTSTSALLTTAAPRPVPTNDTCETATTVGPRAPLVETTTTDDAALDHALSCADPIAPILYRLGDLVYAVSVPPGPARRVRVDASTAGPPGVLTVAIFGGPCGGFTELACANNGLLFVYPPESRSTSVRLEPSLPEGDYFVVVQGSNSFQGVPDIDVRVEVLP